ncbi:aspartate aminotransferase family protein [soil metagenome]
MSTLSRREQTLGPYSPLFYDEPLEFVSATGVWLTDVGGERYLDGYNNVPHVGHTHPRVVEAIRDQASRLNIHTRYLNDRVVEYAERLLTTFGAGLDRVMFTNSGSESNDLALRVASQHSGAHGILISDFSYHGHTQALAQLTTGLRTHEGLGTHVRTIRVPDLDGADRGLDPADVLSTALTEVDAAIASLRDSGHGVATWLFDPLFSTEGLNRLPPGYVGEVARRVRAAGGLVIADEVQSGFGRTGVRFWGHQLHDLSPDLVTMGKPMGNGHPLGGVVLPAALLDEFGPRNMYFNTFGGNPVSSAAGLAVLDVLHDEDLVSRAQVTGEGLRAQLDALAERYGFIGTSRGSGLFTGFSVADGTGPDARPDAQRTKRLVEAVKRDRILISRIGRDDSVLKIRPPMPFGPDETSILIGALDRALSAEDR